MGSSEAYVLTETDFVAGETGDTGSRDGCGTMPLRALSRSKDSRPRATLEQSSQPLLADSNADNKPPGLLQATRSQGTLWFWLVRCYREMRIGHITPYVRD
jgi:hypothetical protein